ncbi:MAG: hypothetical protein WC533_04440 [Candidatus Pacearchaeota archaeon]
MTSNRELVSEYPLSDNIGKPCYGKPCACLCCWHEEYFCIDHSQGPCLVCGGSEEERNTEGFCVPDEDD